MQPGVRTLAGRYALDSLLATGGMGQVWRGRDTVLRRDVAVKVLRSEYTGDPTFLARFRAEARHTAGLTHPNIATLHDYGESSDGPGGERVAWLVMELVQGESLAAVLARGRLDPLRTARLMRQAAAGLGAAHAAGVVHRDVKPGNLLVAPDGTVEITDFGIAWSASSAALTGTGQVIGTAHYLSPEQAAGRPAGPASDVYALGLVGYECLAGRRAFDGDNSLQVVVMQLQDDPPPLPADVPAALRAVVERALHKDPAQRFPDGTALAAALDRVVDTLGDGGTADTAVLPAAPATRVLPATAPRAADRPPVPAGRPAVPAGRAPVADRGGGRAGRHPGRRALAVLAALLAAAAVVAGVLAATGSGTPADPATTSEPAAPSEDPTVLVEAGGLVGRPVAEVRAELEALGLVVDLRPVRTADVPDGQVLTVDPAGALAPGSPVTVTHAAAPPPPPSTAPPSAPSPSAPSSDPAPPEDQEDQGAGWGAGEGAGDDGGGDGDGRGNGNGNGNGRGNGGRGD